MAHKNWYVEGPAFGNCVCGYACPCQFEQDPTHGHCRGFEVMEITKGNFEDVDLSGLKFAVLYAWPGPVYEGNGEMQLIFEPSATPDQRAALETILTGGETDEEATHWWVFRAMCPTLHETAIETIEFTSDMDEGDRGFDIVDSNTGHLCLASAAAVEASIAAVDEDITHS